MNDRGVFPCKQVLTHALAALEECGRYADTVRLYEQYVSCYFTPYSPLLSKSQVAGCAGGDECAVVGLQEETGVEEIVADLHGCSIYLAKAKIRAALAHILRMKLLVHVGFVGEGYVKVRSQSNGVLTYKGVDNPSSSSSFSLVIITGVGRNSREPLEPVLKPLVQKWLETCFRPSLTAAEYKENAGR